MATNSKKTGTAAKIGVMTLAIMNVAAVVSLRGLPAEAEYGLSSAFYYLFAAIVFLIPTSLVAAELAAMFSNKEGGVFRWVGEAYGKRYGFLAIFLQWIESTIYPPLNMRQTVYGNGRSRASVPSRIELNGDFGAVSLSFRIKGKTG